MIKIEWMMMRLLLFCIVCATLLSCATKKDINKRLLPEGIKSATEEIYLIVNNQHKLLQKKQLVFTRNGRIKYSISFDSLGNIIQETKKKLWFIVETYPYKEPYYCKTRWKPKQRERISCYTRKQYKQNEAIYYYNKDGTIEKIVDNFTTFYTQYYYYTLHELTAIVTKDKKNQLIDEIVVHCETKDEKGVCIKETRVSKITNLQEEVWFMPQYK